MFKPDNIENNFFFRLNFESNPDELKAGIVLISEPFLADPNFSRSVVLLTEFNKEDGAFGFIINKPTDIALDEVIEDFPSKDFGFHYGGPVQPNNLFFIHTLEELIPESQNIMPGLAWNGDFEQVLSLARMGQLEASEIKFFGGYSGWSPGQLEGELKEHAWIISELSAEEVMNMPADELWKQSLKNLGPKFSIMADFPEDPMLN